MPRHIKTIVGLFLVFALGAFTLWMVWPRSKDAPGILETSGRVEGDQVVVGAEVGGRIIRLPVQEGQTLKAGELVAELSSEQAKAQLEQAEHDLHAAREEVKQAMARIAVMEREIKTRETSANLAAKQSDAQIGEAETALEKARAQLPRAEAERQRTEKDYARYQQLLAKELIAPQQVDDAKAAYQSAKAEEEVAKRQIAQTEASLKLALTTAIMVELRRREVQQAREQLREARAAFEAARARVQALEAAKARAQADVADTRILAPYEGTVLQKLVQKGQVVVSGTALITFVDMAKLYVKVYLPEGDIGKVRLGNAARIYVDAFPEKYFEASVSQVSQEAEFTPRDIHMKDERVKLVFAVKLALKNPLGFLKPGMPADARVRWRPESAWGDGFG